MHDRWTDRLSEYLDGELAAPERSALEAHLQECAGCRRTVAELEHVVAAARAATDAAPARDLWAGIQARIAPRAAVVPIDSRRALRRRMSFTLPQLAAAAVLFLMLGAGGLYLAMEGVQPQPQAATATAAPGPSAPAAHLASTSHETQADAITELEQALEQDRARLDPATVRVLEQSLATIDQAIADAQAAIAQDPANPYLRRHLDGAMKKKIDILRRAVIMRRAAS